MLFIGPPKHLLKGLNKGRRFSANNNQTTETQTQTNGPSNKQTQCQPDVSIKSSSEHKSSSTCTIDLNKIQNSNGITNQDTESTKFKVDKNGNDIDESSFDTTTNQESK